MKTTKKILAVVMACIMLLGILPMSTFAASTTEVWVAGTNVGGAETTYWLNDGNGGITSVGASESNYNVKYEPSVNYGVGLTFKNASLSKYNKPISWSNALYGIYIPTSLTVTLIGENTVKVNVTESTEVYGLYVSNFLTVKGDGSLNVSATKPIGGPNKATGIYANTLNVEETPTIITEGTDNGMFGYQNITISDNATVVAKGVYGITNYREIVMYNGTLEAIGTSKAINNAILNPNRYDYDAKIKVNDKAEAKGARNMKDGERIYNFKYVKVSPYPPIIAGMRKAMDAVKTFILEDIIGAFIAWLILLFIK